jgi:hypothetical protein
MIKSSFLVFFLCCISCVFAQEIPSLHKTKKIKVINDTILIDINKINPKKFQLFDQFGKPIDSTQYTINYNTAKLFFNNKKHVNDSITVSYFHLPNFITKKYALFDDSSVVPNGKGNLYSLQQNPIKFKPFDGLNTSGSITRGITIGNNQNTTVNSNLDLQITGKISNKVSLRASIQDSNIPLQNDGYSQRLDEFDQIFVELFSDNWNLRGGDLFLENRKSTFLNFNKKVQGLSTNFTFGKPENKTNIFAAGAIVRGQYAKSSFTGQEGNQGPYKLKGKNGELYVLVISGSERVYVNGILLQRGENNHYTIDYNAGEVKFTSLFPITSEMRIVIEYQYSDRNFTRMVTYGGATHETKKWNFGGYIYSENDVKNQPLQQNLSPEQVSVLQNAGDDSTLMNAPSAYIDSYSDNKILYKKTILGTTEFFEYSNNPTDELYTVKFTFVGNNQGNYKLLSNVAIGKIYQYVAPISGIKQGNYEPIVTLIAPTKIQMATVFAKFKPSEKSNYDIEIGISNNDLNLYSTIDDTNNKGIATKILSKQRLISSKTTLDAFADFQWVQQNFKAIERLFTIEFNRDWNIQTVTGNQSLLTTGLLFDFNKNGNAKYQLEKLDFGSSFSGIKNSLSGNYKAKNWIFNTKNSWLKSAETTEKSNFLRTESQAKYNFKKNYVGANFRAEHNQKKNNTTNTHLFPSQKFREFGAFVGRGDSTKVFVETGYFNRVNDSLQTGYLKRVNTSHSMYLKSKLIQTNKANLSIFINYRKLNYEDKTRPSEPSLNSRILYSDSYFNQLIQLTTVYENVSGTLPQQEFTYVEVAPTQGVYMWNDYNSNGIQELQEFEVAPFPDMARYVRVFLPNQVFVKTHQNKFSQSVTINPSKWFNDTGFKKFASHFYNQTSFALDRKIKRISNNFELNPFTNSLENLLGLNASFRNSFFYNRGKQNHSITYNYLNNHLKTLLSIGSQENKTNLHQLQYAHLFKKSWLINGNTAVSKTISISDNYASRNFNINGYSIEPKISYVFNTNCSLGVFYDFKNKENTINNREKLKQNQFGITFNYLSEKQVTVNAEYSLYNNQFTGNAVSPVAFTMLEGLQPNKNSTWKLLLQKKLTQYLDININYMGRKSESLPTIHTGNVQLRAYF